MANVISQTLIDLASEEQKRAEETYGGFQSEHEMYAVLLEEVQETDEESGMVVENLEKLWDSIRNKENSEHLEELVIEIQDGALKTALNALQVVGVCNLAKQYLSEA